MAEQTPVRGVRDEVNASRDRLGSLTGLRFWAALLVVLYHLTRQAGPLPYISDLARYGRSGVTFFFVLSGFVLAWTYLGGIESLRVFYWRRFARIWPLHVIATLLSTAVYFLIGKAVPIGAFLASILLVHAWIPDAAYIRGGNGATWSLSDEAFFYLCFPLLLVVLVRLRRAMVLAIAVLAFLLLVGAWLVVSSEVQRAFYRTWLLDFLPLVRVLQFVVGVGLGVAVGKGWRPRVPMWFAVAAVLGYHLALVPWRREIPDWQPWGPYSASQLLATAVFALLVLAAVGRDLSGRTGLLGRPWALRLGHWSFAWYLVHEIVIRVLVHQYGRPHGNRQTLLFWVVALLISQALAGLLYHLVEHPTERRLRRLVRPRAAGESSITTMAERPARPPDPDEPTTGQVPPTGR